MCPHSNVIYASLHPPCSKVASAEAALRSGQEEAARKVAAAEAAATEATARAEQLAEEAARLRDAVK